MTALLALLGTLLSTTMGAGNWWECGMKWGLGGVELKQLHKVTQLWGGG